MDTGFRRYEGVLDSRVKHGNDGGAPPHPGLLPQGEGIVRLGSGGMGVLLAPNHEVSEMNVFSVFVENVATRVFDAMCGANMSSVRKTMLDNTTQRIRIVA